MERLALMDLLARLVRVGWMVLMEMMRGFLVYQDRKATPGLLEQPALLAQWGR